MQNVSKRILVAEDNPGLAHVLQFNLERSGFDVAVAHDGRRLWDLPNERSLTSSLPTRKCRG